jgi:hypothetical protein
LLQRIHHLDQGIHIAAHLPAAAFHALNGRQRQASRFGETALVHPEQGAGGAYLVGGNHVLDIVKTLLDVSNVVFYFISHVSHITFPGIQQNLRVMPWDFTLTFNQK